MSVDARTAVPPLPRSIWVVAWISLVGQAGALAFRGANYENEVSLVGSMLLGAVLVGWVSAGVVRARTVRVVVVWIVLVLSGITEVVAVFSTNDSTPLLQALLSLVTTVVTLAALAKFQGSEWWRWQRTRPSKEVGPPITGLVAIAVLVGVLGGVMGVDEDGFNFTVNVGT